MSTCIYLCIESIENRKHTRIETHFAQTATRARMPPLDLKRLFEEERARRRAAAGASTSAAAAPDRLEALEARPAVSMADHDVGRFAARRVSGLHYVPEFVTEAEEEALLRSIRAPENDRRWTSGDGGRRVGNWGGRPSDADVSEPLPVWATAVVDALFARRVFESRSAPDDKNPKRAATETRPNHVLVNEYLAPAGITPHNDGDVYAPKVAILTLEGDALIDFWENDGSPTRESDPREDDEEDDAEAKEEDGLRKPSPSPRAQVALRRRSLLVYEGEAYSLRHGIRRGFVDTITRACVNAKRARVNAGETVPRGERRVSVVFVAKRRRHL
jgi:alkylated DNA repair protein alkB family protein 6